MRRAFYYCAAVVLLAGCAPKILQHPQINNTALVADYSIIKEFDTTDYEDALEQFRSNCVNANVQMLYGSLCQRAVGVTDSADFFKTFFDTYRIIDDASLLTGYYEPLLHGSRVRHGSYQYPLYAPPKDLLHVSLGDAYDSLSQMRLRGRLENGSVVAYYDRAYINKYGLDAPVICWVDDRLERFVLEVQGSGRVVLDTNETINVGYADQNGHQYTSIGKLLVAKGAIDAESISLQSIQTWYETHPEEAEALLNENRAFVFFTEQNTTATGSMGVALRAMHSVAIDPKYIPYGAMLALRSDHYKLLAFAEDTGGAIRGASRADLFMGFGKEAAQKAGSLKEDLKLWIWLPKGSVGTITP
jgi:membrane-bound lytic murein transglycosylase A